MRTKTCRFASMPPRQTTNGWRKGISAWVAVTEVICILGGPIVTCRNGRDGHQALSPHPVHRLYPKPRHDPQIPGKECVYLSIPCVNEKRLSSKRRQFRGCGDHNQVGFADTSNHRWAELLVAATKQVALPAD